MFLAMQQHLLIKYLISFKTQGPFVHVDELMEIFRRCKMPESKLLQCIPVSYPPLLAGSCQLRPTEVKDVCFPQFYFFH